MLAAPRDVASCGRGFAATRRAEQTRADGRYRHRAEVVATTASGKALLRCAGTLPPGLDPKPGMSATDSAPVTANSVWASVEDSILCRPARSGKGLLVINPISTPRRRGHHLDVRPDNLTP